MCFFVFFNLEHFIRIKANRLKLVPTPLMKYYSIASCRNHLEKICKEFNLCPKYCNLQTNVSSCFHYQIKNCRGICCGKESIKEYNTRVQKAIDSLGLQTKNLVIKEQGRTENEIGFALILNGIYKGFGYLTQLQDNTLSKPEDYLFFVIPKKDNKDIQRILKNYLLKKEEAIDL